ncbi:MAG: prepilin-type N-terminal cleavage/methylation domain-containing protein [Clostridiaceae bacterium]|nr:prepilin-type N-terminal cleavage/methylation domain-containing protein [Clostridiaceae bacterium]
MLKFFAKTVKSKKGFTLTELIVVVAILGVLAAVTTPSILSYIDEAKVNTDEANATTLENCYKRLLAKGTITDADDGTAIINKIKTEINPIPSCQQTGYFFTLNTGTGEVKAVSTYDDKDADIVLLTSKPKQNNKN